MKGRLLVWLCIFPTLNFDYGSYGEPPAGFFGDISANYEKKHGQGAGIFGGKFRIRLAMKEKPVAISEGKARALDNYNKLILRDDKFANLFTHEMPVVLDGIKFVFLFQGPLIPAYEAEFRENSPIELYCLYASFNTFDNEHLLLVNDFDTIKIIHPLKGVKILKHRAFGIAQPDNTITAVLNIVEYANGQFGIKFDSLIALHEADRLKRVCENNNRCTYSSDGNTIWTLDESSKSLKVIQSPNQFDQQILQPDQALKLLAAGPALDSEWASAPALRQKAVSGSFVGLSYQNKGVVVPVVKNGRVSHAFTERGAYGGIVAVDHEGCFRTIYFPLMNVKVKAGETVVKGQVVGTADKTTAWPIIEGLFYIVQRNACQPNLFHKAIERIDPLRDWKRQ